jgi:hypothetical protein
MARYAPNQTVRLVAPILGSTATVAGLILARRAKGPWSEAILLLWALLSGSITAAMVFQDIEETRARGEQ